jgi:hypothetical protein
VQAAWIQRLPSSVQSAIKILKLFCNGLDHKLSYENHNRAVYFYYGFGSMISLAYCSCKMLSKSSSFLLYQWFHFGRLFFDTNVSLLIFFGCFLTVHHGSWVASNFFLSFNINDIHYDGYVHDDRNDSANRF